MDSDRPHNPWHKPIVDRDGSIVDLDLLTLLPIIQNIADGGDIPATDPIRTLTAVSLARICEGAIEQNSKTIRQGHVKKLRRDAAEFIFAATAEQAHLSGALRMLNALVERGKLSPAEADAFTAERIRHQETLFRKAAFQARLILETIEGFRNRKNVKGRPVGSVADAFVKSRNAEYLVSALKRAQKATGKKSPIDEELFPYFREVVIDALRVGLLPHLGSTDQESIETHTRMLERSHKRATEAWLKRLGIA